MRQRTIATLKKLLEMVTLSHSFHAKSVAQGYKKSKAGRTKMARFVSCLEEVLPILEGIEKKKESTNE